MAIKLKFICDTKAKARLRDGQTGTVYSEWPKRGTAAEETKDLGDELEAVWNYAVFELA